MFTGYNVFIYLQNIDPSVTMFTGYSVFIYLQNIDPSVTQCSQVTVCLYIWYHLLSCDMSEEQSSCFVQSIYNVS